MQFVSRCVVAACRKTAVSARSCAFFPSNHFDGNWRCCECEIIACAFSGNLPISTIPPTSPPRILITYLVCQMQLDAVLHFARVPGSLLAAESPTPDAKGEDSIAVISQTTPSSAFTFAYSLLRLISFSSTRVSNGWLQHTALLPQQLGLPWSRDSIRCS